MRGSTALLLGLAAVLLLGGFTLPGTAQRLWRMGDRAMKRKDYAAATQYYEKAQQVHPQEWALRYNAAVAAAMGKQYEKALSGLHAVAKDGPQELREQAEYNLGNCYLAQGKAEEAVERYKRALYLRPDDVNAKWNLELAKRKQQQQKQQQQEQQQKQQQQKQKQQQKQQQKQDEKPKPDQGKQQQQQQQQMSEDEARRLLQSLSQQDRDLQKQMRQPKQPFREVRPEKDW